MKATRDYGPCASCKKPIKKGDDFAIKGGEFFHMKCSAGDAPPTAAPPAAAQETRDPQKPESARPPRRRSPAQSSGAATAPESSATAPKPKPRKRAPAPKAKPEPKAKPKPKPKPEPKAKPEAKKPPKLPRSQKATKKARKAPAKGKAESTQKDAPPAKRSARSKGESACAMVVRLLCEQKHTDEEILGKVVAAHPERKEKSLKSAISINRSEINRGNFKRLRKQFGLSDKATIERLVKVGRDRVPASKAEAAQKKAAAGK